MKKLLVSLNLLPEVFLVSCAMCCCEGVLGSERKLWGFVFSPVCFEKLSPAVLVLCPLAEGGWGAPHTAAHSLGAFIGGFLAFGCGLLR